MTLTISFSTNGRCFELRKYLSLPVADPGEDQTEARREGPPPPPPLSQGLDDRALPPYLQVWIHHCLPCSYFVHFRPWYRALLFLLTHSSWKVRQNSQSSVQRLFNSLGESAVELQSSLLTEFSKLLSTQKVSKGWIFLHFSLPDNGNYGLSTWIFWTFCSFKGLQRLPSICSTELELMLKQCRVTV